MILVKVAQLGKKVEEVALEDGANVGAALAAAGFRADGFELRLNGATATAATAIRPGDVVTLVPQIKGGK